VKCSKCGTELAPEDKFCGKCGTLRPQLPPRFAEAERRFTSLRARYRAGGLDDATYDTDLQELIVADGAGGRWMLGADSGDWYYFDGQQWVRRDPPLAAAPTMPPAPPRTMPPQVTAAPASPSVAVPVAPPAAKGFPWKWIALGLGGLLLLAVIVVVGALVVPRLLSPDAALPQPDAAAPTADTAAPTVAPSPVALLPRGIPGDALEHPEIGLAFHSHAAVRSEDGNGLYVFGEVENISDGTVDANAYEVLVTFYDASGEVVQTESSWLLSAPLLRPVLDPGQTAYFLHLFSRDLGSEDIVDQADRYAVEIRSTDLPRGYVELSIQELSWSPGDKLTGTVLNDTEFTISRSGPTVWLGLYDAGGQLIDVRSAVSDPGFLAPGRSRSCWAIQNALSEASTIEAVALGVPAEGLIFFDDFSDESGGWELTYGGGDMRYENQALILAAKGAEDGATGFAGAELPGIRVQSFALSFDVMLVSNPGDSGYGVFIGATPGDQYLFALSTEGEYSARGYVEGEQVVFVDYTPSDVIMASEANHILVVAADSKLTFFVNGEQLAEIADVRTTNGAISLSTFSRSEQEVKVAFDNVTLEE
jgi:hypothetical protein